jgi:hypothetical protein
VTQLVVEAMKAWQSKVLNAVAWVIGLRGGSVAYVNLRIVLDVEDEEPTINDIVKNNEEDAMNRVRQDKLTEMESGE